MRWFGYLLFFSTLLQGAIITVDTTSNAIDGSCLDGNCSIHDALSIASEGDTIEFNVTGTITLAQTLHINKTLVLRGPGEANLSISGGNLFQIFDIANADLNISDLTLRDGNATSGNNGGGALHIDQQNDTVHVNRVTFSYNDGNVNGGAIQNYGSLSIQNSSFYDNVASNGGAIDERGMLLEINATHFENNRATYYGGALKLSAYSSGVGGVHLINNSTFRSNTTEHDGGAVFISGYHPQTGYSIFNDTLFERNIALASGGAFYISGAVHVNRCLFFENSARSGGALYIGDYTNKEIHDKGITLNNSTISANNASYSGGAIWATHATANVKLNNLSVVENNSSNVGGILVTEGNVTIKNSMLVHNENFDYSTNVLDDFTSMGYNIVQKLSYRTVFTHATDRNDTAAAYEPLADNGGATSTHALSTGSIAINSGSCHDIDGNTITTDQRNMNRSDGQCDIGAYEASDALSAKAQFIHRFYTNILQRIADEDGIAYWSLELEQTSAAAVAMGFFRSDEFIARSLDDEAFVEILYQTLFDRSSIGDAGRAFWLASLSAGASRDSVIYGFLNSPEFEALATQFGVTALRVEDRINFNAFSASGLEGFINRFYNIILDRDPDVSGLNHWLTALQGGTANVSDIALGFMLSEEFIGRQFSDDAFVEACYAAFFDREADASGKRHWLAGLSADSNREAVINGFLASAEFTALAASFGITAQQ